MLFSGRSMQRRMHPGKFMVPLDQSRVSTSHGFWVTEEPGVLHQQVPQVEEVPAQIFCRMQENKRQLQKNYERYEKTQK